MRPDALAALTEADWSDELFYKMVLIYDLKLLVK